MLQQFDSDRSGTMELDEFAKLVEHLRKLWYESARRESAELRAQLKKAQDELAAMGTKNWIPPDVRAAFERCDSNKSGKIDYGELRSALQGVGGLDASVEYAQVQRRGRS